jgi:hypothetical protein
MVILLTVDRDHLYALLKGQYRKSFLAAFFSLCIYSVRGPDFEATRISNSLYFFFFKDILPRTFISISGDSTLMALALLEIALIQTKRREKIL